jgi:hypothetical protein
LTDIPALIEQVRNSRDEKSAVAAAKRFYELCDVHHKQNRIPMICSGEYDVLTPLVQLVMSEKNEGARHAACLALNNLSIPTENKPVMALGPVSKDLIVGLSKFMAADNKDAYLGCICLMNLAFLEATSSNILQYLPDPDGFSRTPLRNPNSLLRVLEKIIRQPIPADQLAGQLPVSKSPQLQKNRWACGLLRNLTSNQENAALLGQTDIPRLVLNNIRSSTDPTFHWPTNSLEDFSLHTILHLAQWPVSREALLDAGAIQVVAPILVEGKLQGLRATMICALLDAPWSTFAECGRTAAEVLVELVSNIMKTRSKVDQYEYSVFKLHTATKAYLGLARATENAEAAAEATRMMLASPSAIAFLLLAISEWISYSEDDESDCVSDAASAEYALGALEVLLPVILVSTTTDLMGDTTETKQASSAVSQILGDLGAKSSTTSDTKIKALEIKATVTNADHVARPLLEQAYDLWKGLSK